MYAKVLKINLRKKLYEGCTTMKELVGNIYEVSTGEDMGNKIQIKVEHATRTLYWWLYLSDVMFGETKEELK